MKGGRALVLVRALIALTAVGLWAGTALAGGGPALLAQASGDDEVFWDSGPGAADGASAAADAGGSDEVIDAGDGGSAADEDIILPDDGGGPKYPSRSLLKQPGLRQWLGDVKLGGYWENELAVDTKQDSPEEDKVDFRSKVYGYGSYTFSNQTKLHLSAIAYYWALEGGKDRQQSEIELYEGYLRFHFPEADIYVGQMIVRWGAGDLFAPTNNINPVNYRVFVDPDPEDIRIPLPMVKTDLFFDKVTVEALYIPIFQSAIMDLAGADLSLVQTRKGADQLLSDVGVDIGFIQTIKNVTAQRLDFQEPRFMTGDAAARVTYREGDSHLELVYFTGREDLPLLLYQEYPAPVGSGPGEGALEFAFDRYDSYGITWLRDYDQIKVHLEYVGSPERSLTRALDTNNDGVIDRTRRTRHPWQSVAIELDYLDPQKFFLKLGAMRSSYFGAPDDVIFISTDSIYFLIYFRYLAIEGLTPELRILNLQSNSNQWFLSPRLSAKVADQFLVTCGLNLFTGSGTTVNQASPDFSPITIISDNNQAFVSVRWSF